MNQMIQTFKNAWKIADIRKKLLFTLFIVLIYRVGANLYVPFVNAKAISNASLTSGTSNLTQGIFGMINLFSGGAFEQASLFALNVSPYITASIVMQLLTIAIPYLENLSKEGEEGKKKINGYTRLVTAILSLVTAFGYVSLLDNSSLGSYGNYLTVQKSDGAMYYFAYVVMIACFCAGAAIIMWMAERINERGIGNGISMILFANIISSIPGMVGTLATLVWWQIIIVLVGIVALVLFIVFINDAERRIPIQYAKRVVGRKVYGGQNTNLPIKVAMSGVMPIIFAQSICSLPATICAFTGKTSGWWYDHVWSSSSWIYAVIYFIMIFFFSWFYSTIQYDTVEISNNLKSNGGFIPGFRPGKPTADFIQKVINKIIVFGSVYLGIVALLPIIAGNLMEGVKNLAIGGTSVIIVVGVALETVKALEAQMLMRHYKGFLD